MNSTRTVWWAVLAGVALGLPGCAARQDLNEMNWPYASVTGYRGIPPHLRGVPLFAGRWIVADPRGTVLTETTDPRFLARLSFEEPRRLSFLDLGPGTEIETLAFRESGRSALMVGAVTSPHHGRAVVARSLLLVDLEQGILLDTLPLPRDGVARGIAVDPHRNRAYVLHDDGLGSGAVHEVDLYDGRRFEQPVGGVPAGVDRKGIVLDRTMRHLFCLVGGEPATPDFAPVTDTEPEGPQLVRLDTDSLAVQERLPLDGRFEPRALAYDENRDRVYALITRHDRSHLVTYDVGFQEKRGFIDLPEKMSDVYLSGGYAFLPGAHGIYVVDLDIESLISAPALRLDLTGEIVVSEDVSLALVSFQATDIGGPPGVALVGLRAGSILDVLR